MKGVARETTIVVSSAVYSLHIVDIGLQDPHVKEHSLGYIRLFLSITPYEEEVSYK